MNTALITAMEADFAAPLVDDWGETLTIQSATVTYSAGQAAISYVTAGSELGIFQDRTGMVSQEEITRYQEGLADMPMYVYFASADSVVNEKSRVVRNSLNYRVQKVNRYESHAEVHLRAESDR